MCVPLVSVVMVVRNVERFLPESIESVLNQTFRDFEFIIVDFGSTDRSEAIASAYAAADARIKLHKIPDCRLAEARNAACFLAEGRYIAIMDADDVSLPSRLEWELEFAEKHPEIGLLGGATEWIDAQGMPVDAHNFPTSMQEIKTDHDAIRAELPNRCSFCQSTVLLRTDAFRSAGGYRLAFAQTEDYDLWLRISERFRVANLKQVVLKYRIHPHQVSLRQRRAQTLCKLAAQASAKARETAHLDPLDEVEDITPQTLNRLGVGDAQQENELILEYRQWVQAMAIAGEYSAALEAATEVLGTRFRNVDRRQIADLHLVVARIHFGTKQFLKGLLALAQAVTAQPTLLGKPLKPLLRPLGVVR